VTPRRHPPRRGSAPRRAAAGGPGVRGPGPDGHPVPCARSCWSTTGVTMGWPASEPVGELLPGRSFWQARHRRISCSTRTVRWTGGSGAQRRSPRLAGWTWLSCAPSATPRATGATYLVRRCRDGVVL